MTTFFRRRRLLSSWCSTRLHSALGAVTFTMAVTCLTATCLEKKHTLPPAISFPKDQQPWFMHPYSRCATVLYTHTIAMYGHRQPQGSEIFISPLRASSWEQGHYFSHCLKRNKKIKISSSPTEKAQGDKPLEVRGAEEPSWSYVLLWVTSRVTEWFKTPVYLPSSFSSPSNSPHVGFLSGLTEGLSEDARGWRECDIWIVSCSKYIHGT